MFTIWKKISLIINANIKCSDWKKYLYTICYKFY